MVNVMQQHLDTASLNWCCMGSDTHSSGIADPAADWGILDTDRAESHLAAACDSGLDKVDTRDWYRMKAVVDIPDNWDCPRYSGTEGIHWHSAS